MKKKILFCNEASYMNSGYANYGREVISRLHAKGKYEIAELGCYAVIEDPRGMGLPWRFYPNAVSMNDSRYEKYNSSTPNQFGFWRFDLVCLDFKPDIVVDVRDPWMFEYQSFSPLRDFFHWVVMPAVDSLPQRLEWLNTFDTADILVPYTEWAKKGLSNFKNLWSNTTPAGINPDVYMPLSNKKTKLGIPENSFVIGGVMRNQKRKLIPAMMEVAHALINKTNNKNIFLYLHTTYPEMAGWELPKLLVDFNLMDNVLFTYRCRSCKHFFASKFRGHNIDCPNCNNTSCSMPNTTNGIKDYEMVEIYNCFDIFLQYAICEGFGMPQIEAGACGVPVFSVDYSAMSEVVRNIGGYPLPLSTLSYELDSHAKRAYPDINSTVEKITEFMNKTNDEQQSIKQNARQLTIQNYNWRDTANEWEKILDSLDSASKKPWDHPDKFIIPEIIEIDYSLEPFELVKSLCYNIIKDRRLLNTEFGQRAIREAEQGLARVSNGIKSFSKEQMVQKFEQYANNKVFIDDIRLSDRKLTEDYIQYGQPK